MSEERLSASHLVDREPPTAAGKLGGTTHDQSLHLYPDAEIRASAQFNEPGAVYRISCIDFISTGAYDRLRDQVRLFADVADLERLHALLGRHIAAVREYQREHGEEGEP